MAKTRNPATAVHYNSYIQQDSALVLAAQKPMEWSENFQDLSVFCNSGSKMVDNSVLQLGEQLDTPIITVNDEFDFGLRSSSRVSHENLEDADPWDLNTQQQPSLPQTSNVRQWESVTDWLCSSPNMEFEYEPPLTPFIVPVTAQQEEKVSVQNVEQNEHPPAEKLPDLNIGIGKLNGTDNKEQAIDIVKLLDRTSKIDNNISKYSNRTHLSQLSAGNNNKATASINRSTSNRSSTTLRLPVKVLRSNLIRSEGTISSNKNRRDLSTNSLSSIFNTEEPFVKVPVNQRPLLTSPGNAKRNAMPLVVAATKEVPANVLQNTAPSKKPANDVASTVETVEANEYILPDIKVEPVDEEIGYNNDKEGLDTNKPNRSFKAPVKQVKKLKLDIKSAARINSGAVLTPTTAVLGESLDTPDVLKPLLIDNRDFDLIKYFEADEVPGISFSNNNSPVVETRKTIPTVDTPVDCEEEKREAPYRKGKVLSTIKEEDISEEPQQGTATPPRRASYKRKLTSRTVARKRQFDDFDSESSDFSDNYMDNEDDDETFHLPMKSKYTKRQRTSSRSSTFTEVSPGKRKVSSSGIDSDQDSIISVDRYRELRDRNNEASKRSRMNRKSREIQMKEKAVELEQENRNLKAKACQLEKLVKTFREGMMKLVLSRRN